MAENEVKLTPKRAAQILIHDWLKGSTVSPWFMDAKEMTDKLSDHNYKVTELRQKQILEQAEKIVAPLKNKLASRIQDFAVL